MNHADSVGSASLSLASYLEVWWWWRSENDQDICNLKANRNHRHGVLSSEGAKGSSSPGLYEWSTSKLQTDDSSVQALENEMC